jgi:hypothetical protein
MATSTMHVHATWQLAHHANCIGALVVFILMHSNAARKKNFKDKKKQLK